MLGYLSLDIVCSSKLTVFLELCSQKTVHFREQIMSVNKYPSIQCISVPKGGYCLLIQYERKSHPGGSGLCHQDNEFYPLPVKLFGKSFLDKKISNYRISVEDEIMLVLVQCEID